MSFSASYKEMCVAAQELQSSWRPGVGDYFLLSTNYCDDLKDICTSNKPCSDCIDMCNVFILASQFNSNGFLFNPRLCNREGGIKLNDTVASIFIASTGTVSNFAKEIQNSQSTFQDNTYWIPAISDYYKLISPTQDSVITKTAPPFVSLIEDFLEHVNACPPKAFRTSEEAWLHFYMTKLHNKHWDGKNWRFLR